MVLLKFLRKKVKYIYFKVKYRKEIKALSKRKTFKY
jgi:hypothetical protein